MESSGSGDDAAERGHDPALMTLTLRDGRMVGVTSGALQIGDEEFALGWLRDARQIVPDPPTVALRVAGRGLVEFTPVSAEQARLALEAIYRMRPDLRPLGFEAPTVIPDWWPAASGASRAAEWESLSGEYVSTGQSGAGTLSGGYPP